MIKLNTAIIIYPDTYDALSLVRCEFELRTQTVTFYLAPARTTPTDIYLGVKQDVNGQLQLRFPELFRTVAIQQNVNDPDPVLQDLLQQFAVFLENFEQQIVLTQHEPGGMATTPQQIGTTEWSLESTYEPNAGRVVGVEAIAGKQ
jgi:hypothetical protein